MENIHLIGISGSIRTASHNTLLLKTCLELLPENMSMEFASYHDVPFYNEDDDLPATPVRPASVQRFRDQVAGAAGIVIASPEYNWSIPGGLKNVIDWTSRGADSPLRGMPVALIGATTSLWGTVRMQLAFLPVFQTLNMKPVFQPEVYIAQANTKFDQHGSLTDQTARELIRKKLQNLKALILQSKK